jgi:hypothetical protein
MRGQGQQLSGAGAFFQGIGQANYWTAQANIANEQARSMFYDNVVKHAETYWQRKSMYQNNREQPPTAEELAKYARVRAPEGLTVSDFDAATRRLNWPEALMTPEFERQRIAIEFVVVNHGIGAQGVEKLAEQMEARLKTRVEEMDANDYMAGKNFLTGLAVESSATPRAEAVAAKPTLRAIARR